MLNRISRVFQFYWCFVLAEEILEMDRFRKLRIAFYTAKMAYQANKMRRVFREYRIMKGYTLKIPKISFQPPDDLDEERAALGLPPLRSLYV